MLKISVVTSTYNNESELLRLFDSLIMQEEFLYEWIIVDDGSTDGTWEMIKDFIRIDPSFKIEALQQAKKGSRYTTNLNNGFRKAKGDVIFVVNGDTQLQANTLKTLRMSFVKGSAGSAMRLYHDPNGNFIGYDWRTPDGTEQILKINDWPEWYSHLTLNGAIIDREVFKKGFYLDERFTGYGRDDWTYFLQLGRAGIHLYQYNNVRILCEKEDPKPDNPANVKLFEEELMKR